MRDLTATQIFQFVSISSLVPPIILPIAILVGLPWLQRLWVKAIVAILLSWAISIFYTAMVYNPAGIASGIEQRIDSPTMKFDNNTIASTILGGWLLPTISVGVFFLVRNIFARRNSVASDG